MDVSVASDMLSFILAAGCGRTTYTGRDVDTPPDVAVICVVPLDTAVTRPLASTVATSGSLLNHTTTAPGMIVLPVSCTSPSAEQSRRPSSALQMSGVMVMLPASCMTVTVALAVA